MKTPSFSRLVLAKENINHLLLGRKSFSLLHVEFEIIMKSRDFK